MGLAPGRALDVGSGEGRNALWLAERGWAHRSRSLLRRGAKLAASPAVGTLHVDWVVADLRSFQPPPSTFNLVIQFFVHFRAEQRRALLQRAAAALRAGGIILVVGYDVSHLGEGAGGGARNPSLPAVSSGTSARRGSNQLE